MTVYGYVRVSSIEQESGHGPEVQRRAIVDYCRSKGLGEPVIIEESFSGESVTGRKEMLTLLAKVREEQESGTQAHVVFRSSDRLSRELMDQEGVVADAFSRGYRLHSTLSHEADLFDPVYAGDPMRVAIRQFFGIVNQLDKNIIQQRLDGGLFMKASKGGSTGGRYPFGYYGVNGDIQIDPTEAPAVRTAFDASDRGLDLASIAAILAHHHPEQCGHWTKTHVKRLLDRRELYQAGMYRSRLGVAPTYHPELVIVSGGEPPVLAAPGVILWDKIPNPVSASTLAMLLGRSVSWCQRRVADLGIPVLWRKTRMMIPLHEAKRIAELGDS